MFYNTIVYMLEYMQYLLIYNDVKIAIYRVT